MRPPGPKLQVFPHAFQARCAEGGAWTWDELVDALRLTGEKPRARVNGATCRTLVSQCLRGMQSGPWGRYLLDPAFASGAAELFVECKLGGLFAPGFADVVASLAEGARERAEVLGKLFARYQAELEQRQWADPADALMEARERVLNAGTQLLAEVEILELRGFTRLRPLELELVLSVAARFEATGREFILHAQSTGNSVLDAATDGLFQAFEKHGELSPLSIDKEAVAGPLARVVEQLFVPRGDPLGAVTGLKVASYASSAEELRQVGRGVQSALAQGISPERIAVVFPELGAASEHLLQRLEDAGISAAAGTHTALTQVPWTRRLLRLALLAEDGLPVAAVGAWLAAAAPGTLSAGSLEGAGRVLRAAGLRDDRLGAEGEDGAYALRLGRLAQRLRARHRTEDADEVERVAAAVALLRRLALGLPVRAKLLEHLHAWRNALKKLAPAVALTSTEPPEPVRATPPPPPPLERPRRKAEGQRRRAEAAGQLSLFGNALPEPAPREVATPPVATAAGADVLPLAWDALAPRLFRARAREQRALEALHALAEKLELALQQTGLASLTMERRVFQRWLWEGALAEQREGEGETGEGLAIEGVAVVELGMLQGRRFDRLFMAGLTEGQLPRRPPPHPLFGDEERGHVNRTLHRPVFELMAGEGDLRGAASLVTDRLHFGLSLLAADGAVQLSWARHDDSGAEQRASPFVLELCAAAGVLPDSVPYAPVQPAAGAVSEQELRSAAALEKYVPRALRMTPADPVAAALGELTEAEPWRGETDAIANMELERLRFFSDARRAPGPYSGAVLDRGLEAALAEKFRFGPEHPLSASALGRFGNCRYQGFLAYALRLEEPSEAGEEQDSRDRGSFWHHLLEELFPKLEAQGLLGRTLEELPEELLGASLAAAVEAAEQGTHVGHRALWQLGRERAVAMVRRLLAQDHHGLPFGGVPLHTELTFGRKTAPPEWREVVIPARLPGEEPIHVEGTIDRLDHGPEGVGVVDYKTSLQGVPQKKDTLLVSEFQLPLYLFAARAAGHAAVKDAAWLSMRDGTVLRLSAVVGEVGREMEALLADDAPNRQLLLATGQPNLANATHRVVGALRAGDFAIRSHECTFCAFASVCRLSERRLEDSE